MAWTEVLQARELPPGGKKTVKAGAAEILLVRTEEGALHAVEGKCPHAGAPLEQGAVCNGRLVCPWHTGTFSLEDGALVEPPPLRALKIFAVREEDGAIEVDPEPRNRPTLAARDENEPAKKTGGDLHVVTIGAGAAAASAVCTLRQGGFAGTLTLIDPVADEPIDRTMLSKFTLEGKKPLKDIPLFNPEEAKALKLERLRARVEQLDANGSLRTSDGQTLRFDAALLAPGGTPSKLGIPGEDGPNVVNIRHSSDVETIDRLLGADPNGKEIVLIGDSFIAFEAASALTGRGCKTTLVCRSPQPFSKKFGEAPAHALVSLHRSKGVSLKLGAEARAIGQDAVVLKSGETLPADVVVIAVGVKPALGFDHTLELADDEGVAVDASLAVSDRLWAAGDIASVGGTRIEHWRLAQQHGRAAAQAMLRMMGAASGEEQSIVPFFWTSHFGKRLGYVGHADSWEELQVDGSLGDLQFLAYYIKRDKVAAVLGCGKDAALAMLAEQMRRPLTLEAARQAAEKA